MRKPSALRGAVHTVIDLVSWLANTAVVAYALVQLIKGGEPWWLYAALLCISAITVAGVPVMYYRLYRRARRIVEHGETGQ